MKYISTRGGVAPVSFDEAVMMGLATDGGLILPEKIPQISEATLRAWAYLSFRDLAVEIMSLFVGDTIPRVDLVDLVRRSYATFWHSEVTPLVKVGKLNILELFHGPTASFKDVALQFLGNLFEYFLARDGGRLNIVGATSGDTGSAAIAGVRGKKGINIFILHPEGRVSPVQERQMTTVLDTNVHNIAIRGTFDDGQNIVKALFNDQAFKREYHLGAVNSINWARILAQVVYYFYAWARLTEGNTERQVNFAVPTGNFGDVFAGYVAKRMGLPVNRLIIATNRNDIIARFVHTGVYETGEVYPTLSPAMDIQVASNLERYLYYLVGEDPRMVRAFMEDVATTGRAEVDEARGCEVAQDLLAASVDDDGTMGQILMTYLAGCYILDPHSAIGVRVAAGRPDTICLATAHPAKFEDAVYGAIGRCAEPPACLQGLMEMETRCAILDASEPAIRLFIEETLRGA